MPTVLKIFFVGLIAFVPHASDNELTVLLLDGREESFASDGSKIERHRPLLLARAGDCRGDCSGDAQAIADFMFEARMEPGGDTMKMLEKSLQKGGAWVLNDSLLAIRSATARAGGGLDICRDRRPQGRRLPADRRQLEDFSWVAELKKIRPSAGAVDPDVLGERPEKDLIAARLRLTSGSIRTYSLVHLDEQIPTFAFKTLRGKPAKTGYSQALAHWTVAEIPLPDCKVTIAEKNFKTGAERTMELSPETCEGGVIEMAVMNIPESSYRLSKEGSAGHHAIGHHFEMYYELLNLRPAGKNRPVPYPAADAMDKAQLDEGAPASDFLDSITPTVPKGLTSQPICPPVVM